MTDKANPISKESMEYVYREYTRLYESLEVHIKSSFDDFRLIGAVSILLAWTPIIDSIHQLSGNTEGINGTNYTLLLLLGFIVILFIIAIIMMRDLLKQSLINYLIQQIEVYESEIRAFLGETNTRIFTSGEQWKQWRESNYRRVLVRYFILFVSILLFFPPIVLVMQQPAWYALVYLAIATLILAIYVNTVRVVGLG